MKIVAFFNNKGGVGKTSLVYHLAWMYSEQGVRCLAVDLDPQANLSSMFLDEERLETLWGNENSTVFTMIRPLAERSGDISSGHPQMFTQSLGLCVGDMALTRFEDILSENWPKCLGGDAGAFRVMSAFYRVVVASGRQMGASIALLDVGPNLGALNRAALIASDAVVVPLGADLFSLQGLKNLGPALREWRVGWSKRQGEVPKKLGFDLPEGSMLPLGYIVSQHGIRESRPVKAYQRWLNQIPEVYRTAIHNQPGAADNSEQDNLGLLKHYRSLMPLAMEAKKPMFSLKNADGAIGAHAEAVRDCYKDFKVLAQKIGERLLGKAPF